MRTLHECRAKAIALHRKNDRCGLPPPRVEEVMRRALGNFNRLLSAKMKREGIEFPADRHEQAATYAPPVMIGPLIDD